MPTPTVGTVTHIPSISGGAGDTIAVNHTCDANATRLQVFTCWGASGGPASDAINASYNGVGLTREGAGGHADNWSNAEHHYRDNPPTGLALSVSCNHSGGINPSQMVGTAVTVLGSLTGGMENQGFSALAVPAVIQVDNSADGDLMLGAVFTDGSVNSLLTDSPAVEIDTEEDINSDSDYECSKTLPTGPFGIINWSLGTSDNWASAGVSIKGAAAVSSVPPPRQVARQLYVMP